MLWQFAVLNEGEREAPLGIVVHQIGHVPKWITTNKQAETVFGVLFNRDTVYANVLGPGGSYSRVKKTYSDADYLDYASTKVSLPTYIQIRGSWNTEVSDLDQVLKQLSVKFLGDDHV